MVDFTSYPWNSVKESPLQEIQLDPRLNAYSEFIIGQNRSSVFTLCGFSLKLPYICISDLSVP